ncbi:MAG: adenosylcobinamide-GDP ribazoletransferase [Planctomycetes bacterium]|nr:adenosylcobinamide-GDP ribazoletransferase [Planctomycetota bacterium]
MWALKFLTIIPIDREDRIKPKDFGSVVCWFPVVGLCIGEIKVLQYPSFARRGLRRDGSTRSSA